MESRLPKIKSIVKQTANWVIRIMGSLILLFLVWYAMRTLQYMLPVAGHEDLVEIPDSVIRNLAAAALILLLYAVLTAVEKKAGDKITIWCKRIAVTLGMLWQGIAGLCWVLAADRVPSADQASVIGAAIDFIQGDYGTLAPDHYCGLYAHQLGPAAMEEMLFRILGEADYHVIQIVFVLLNVAGMHLRHSEGSFRQTCGGDHGDTACGQLYGICLLYQLGLRRDSLGILFPVFRMDAGPIYQIWKNGITGGHCDSSYTGNSAA